MSQQEFGRNERGQEIRYDVYTERDWEERSPTFSYTAKRFSIKRLIGECEEHGITGPIVIVSHITMNKWGFDIVDQAIDIRNGQVVW